MPLSCGPNSNESGDETNRKTLNEVACERRLRDKYEFKDGAIVHIEVGRDE
jgi:hypothetical protein